MDSVHFGQPEAAEVAHRRALEGAVRQQAVEAERADVRGQVREAYLLMNHPVNEDPSTRGDRTMKRLATVAAVLIAMLVVAVPAMGQSENAGILESAGRLAAGVALQPGQPNRGGGAGKIITTLAMIAGGGALAYLGKPDYVPSNFIPGNTPNRIDINSYLGPGSYSGHSYRLVRRRGADHGKYFVGTCGQNGPTTGSCRVDMGLVNRALRANYENGYTDGFDDGFHRGRIDGHEQGWTDGQKSVIEIMDANGFTVYQGEFKPASYTKERFSDKVAMRLGGVGLAAAGALVALFWPDSPARNLDLTPIPGGGRVGASFGF